MAALTWRETTVRAGRLPPPEAAHRTHGVEDDVDLQVDDSFGRSCQLLVFQQVGLLLAVTDLRRLNVRIQTRFRETEESV